MSGVEGSVLVTALERIGRARARVENEIELALAEVAREESTNRRAIEEGHRRLVALRSLRREQEALKAGLVADVAAEEAAAVAAGLEADTRRFLERAAVMAEAVAARDARLEEDLKAPELAAALVEYQNYQDVEPTLSTMPPPIRKSLVEKHERVLRRLEPIIRAANAGPPPLAAPAMGVGVVAAMDPPEGPPEALVVVFPVPYAAYSDWRDRPEDLATSLCHRLLAALFRLLQEIGAADAPVQYDSVRGNLAVQVWLGDHPVPVDLREATFEHFSQVYEEAIELWAAGVEVYTVWVRPELLLGAEGDP